MLACFLAIMSAYSHNLSVMKNSVGRNIIHICGLASFAYNLKSSEFEGVGQRNVIGSISDKILGLQLALKMAQRSSPCILHICLDEEISDTDDIESRHDEENRLLSSLREGISHSYSESIAGELPPILIVISTKDDMEGGPLASMILYDSISVDAPNDIYAKALWNDNDTFPDAKNDLAGRSANEIQFLGNFVRKKKFDQLQNNIDLGLFSVANALSNAMHCKDDVDLFQSFNQMSSALIPNVKWDDIGGLSHVRDEIIDAIELPLLHPHLFVGSRRSGILFFGPPGSGKTLVAKAVASECGLPFISVKGPELLGSYVGESEANIRKVFASAREAAASSIYKDDRGGAAILFFDEIDSLAPRRGELGDGGGVMERVVSTLLGEMDRDINTDSLDCKPCHVFVIGATNRPDLLDPSLLRPGRFDRIVYLGLAKEREDRIQILAAQTRKFTFRDGIDSEKMAAEVIDRIPQSLSGADFSGVASRALMLAFKRVCDMADNEAVSKNSTVESILNDWPKDKLTPRVDAEDFIAAANEIHPSVNDEELKKYEAMRNEYCHER
jgi:peroxin-6